MKHSYPASQSAGNFTNELVGFMAFFWSKTVFLPQIGMDFLECHKYTFSENTGSLESSWKWLASSGNFNLGNYISK